MKSTLKPILIFVVFLVIAACSGEKKAPSDSASTQTGSDSEPVKMPSNSVFMNSSSSSKEYKSELANLIRSNPGQLTYYFERYLKDTRDGKEYMVVRCTGKSVDATALVLVERWNKIEGIQASKGEGYTGAELRGLQLDLEEGASGTIFIYKDVEKVID